LALGEVIAAALVFDLGVLGAFFLVDAAASASELSSIASSLVLSFAAFFFFFLVAVAGAAAAVVEVEDDFSFPELSSSTPASERAWRIMSLPIVPRV
jgi:hypothetical protein